MGEGQGMATIAATADRQGFSRSPAVPEPGTETDREISSATPMMRQYLEAKALHPGAILFFRLGDFYEMFQEDAVKASELLQIALTARSKGEDRVPMCGVPHHSARRYIAKLIEHGLKVAICEQVEEPGAGPGIVRREVTRIITPGMVLDDEVLETRANNFLAAVRPGKERWGAALLDASTGEFTAFEARSLQELSEQLGRAEPREILVPEEETSARWVEDLLASLPRRPALASLDRGAFEPSRAAAFLKAHFAVTYLEGFGVSDAPQATAAAGAALRYLKNTQKTEAPHVDRVTFAQPTDALVLDDATRSNLEIIRTVREGSRQGSLLGVLDRTATAMGARKLTRWLTAPLRSLPQIATRLEAVEELKGQTALSEALFARLKEIADLERLCGRLSLGAGNARDLRSLAISLAALPKLGHALSHCQSPLLRMLVMPLTVLGELEQVLAAAVVDEPSLSLKEGGIFRAGYSAELDEWVRFSTSGKEVLLQIETRERQRTGIESLKVR